MAPIAPVHRYVLPWESSEAVGWHDSTLGHALLVDCFGPEGYGRRRDLHRALAADVLAALPRRGWTLTSAALVEWAVRSHGTLILWRGPLRLVHFGDWRPRRLEIAEEETVEAAT